MTTLLPAPAPRPTTDGTDDLTHAWCCDPDRALCGTDLADAEATTDAVDCVVCIDLITAPCPTCGWTLNSENH